MTFDVIWLDSAERDLNDLADYIAEHDSLNMAEYVVAKILDATAALALHPDAGAYVKELESIGNREYRQVFFKPYRVIYRVAGRKVFIYIVADGRRDLQALLARRLLA